MQSGEGNNSPTEMGFMADIWIFGLTAHGKSLRAEGNHEI